MFVNLNDITLPVTASSTPTAVAIPGNALNCTRVRVFNDSGATVLIKGETSGTSTLLAPVSGTAYAGTAIPNLGVELYTETTGWTHISIYSASGTGLVHIQFTYGQ